MFEKEIAFVGACQNYFDKMEEVSRKAVVLEALKKDPSFMTDLEFFDWVNSAPIKELEEFGSGKWRWLEKFDEQYKNESFDEEGEDDYIDNYDYDWDKDDNWVDGKYSPKRRPLIRPEIQYWPAERKNVLHIAPGFEINLTRGYQRNSDYYIAKSFIETNFFYCFFEMAIEKYSLWGGQDFAVITTEDTYSKLISLFLHIKAPWVYGKFIEKVISNKPADMTFVSNEFSPCFLIVEKDKKHESLSRFYPSIA
jgi:hypothetical protein